MSVERTLAWVREEHPVWDDDKQRVIGRAPQGAFVLPFHDGDDLPGEWWSARDGDEVVGYGRLDIGWGGDAEVLLAVDPDRQHRGIGAFVLARLEDEASRSGINYVYNTIRDHSAREDVHDWLSVRGFRDASDGVLRKRVGATDREQPRRAPTQVSDQSRRAGDRPPGHEEQGGYVDVEDHRF